MHEYLGMLLDSAISEHWPDLLIATLLAVSGYLGRVYLLSNENRHKRAEDKFEKTDEKISRIDGRLEVIEDRCGVRKVESREG